MTRKGLAGLRQFFVQILEFLLHQETHGGLLDELRDAGGRGMRAMGCAEGVVHVNAVAQFGEGLGKPGIVRLFLRVETHVFEQGDIAFLHFGDDLFRIGPNAIVAESDRMIDQIVQRDADRPKRIFLHRLSLRPAEMRHQDRLRALFPEVIDRRQTFAHPRVVGDDDLAVAFLGRHIEIDPNQDAFAAHIEIANAEFSH